MKPTDKEINHWQELRQERPELFVPVRGFEFAHHCYDLLGNMGLLQMPMLPVHVRRMWNNEERRNYKNHCILEARHGVVLVGPFISADEKQVMNQAIKEGLPFALLTPDAFPDNYEVPDALLGPLAEGSLLIMNPWPSREKTAPITRQECLTLNQMAEAIAGEDWFE